MKEDLTKNSSQGKFQHILFNGWTFLLCVIMLPLFVFAIYTVGKSEGPLPVLNKDWKLQPFTLTDQYGTPFSLNDMKGKICLVDFFFTSCNTICPTMSSNLMSVQDSFRNNPGVVIVSFSMDPERDTQSKLLEYANAYGADGKQWYFLSGDKKIVYDLARYGFRVIAYEGDPQQFVHSEKIVLIDQDLMIRGYYDGTKADEVAKLIKDMKRIQR